MYATQLPGSRDLFDLNLGETTSAFRNTLDRITTQTLPIFETNLERLEPVIKRIGQSIDHIDRTVMDIDNRIIPRLEKSLWWSNLTLKILVLFIVLASIYLVQLLLQRYNNIKLPSSSS